MATTTAAKKKAATSKAGTKAAASAKKAPAKKAVVKAASKAPAKKAPAKKAPAKKAPAKKAPAKKAPAKKAPAKKAPAKKATKAAAKAPAKRSPAKAPAKKAAPPKLTEAQKKFLVGQRVALEAERTTYVHQAEVFTAEAKQLAEEREPGDVQFDEESGEGDTLAVERERDLVMSARARDAVDQIDRALEKLIDGSYGVCEGCGSTIPKERLKAIPEALLCVTCKTQGIGY